MVKIVALINVKSRQGYAYHVPNQQTVIEKGNRRLEDVPDGQKPTRITSDLGSEFNSRILQIVRE